MSSPRRSARLTWSGRGLVYDGASEQAASVTLDGASEEGPSPMGALLLSLAGCMAIDIQTILQKGRVPLDALHVEIAGERAADPPRRFTRIVMDVRVRGPSEADEGKLARAVELSRERYCSVFHTLRPDLEVLIQTHRE